jgi:hypothetical protein
VPQYRHRKDWKPKKGNGMAIRNVGAMAGLGWLKNAINLGRNRPGAVFGGAALLLVAAVVAAFAGALVQGVLVAALGTSLTAMVAGTLLLVVVMLVVVSMLMVGYLRLVDAVESGRPAGALDVFGGFRDFAASARTIGFVLLLTLAQYIIMGGLLWLLAGGVVEWYAQTMQAQMAGAMPPMTLPDGLGIATLIMLVLGMVTFAVQSIGLGQIALRGRGIGGAFGDGLSGTFRNLPAVLVFVLSFFVAAIVAGIAAFVVALLVGLLAKIAGAWLGIVLGVPLYVLAMLAVYVVMFGAMYHLWRDVCGDGSDAVGMPAQAVTV